jgi:phage shock protein A
MDNDVLGSHNSRIAVIEEKISHQEMALLDLKKELEKLEEEFKNFRHKANGLLHSNTNDLNLLDKSFCDFKKSVEKSIIKLKSKIEEFSLDKAKIMGICVVIGPIIYFLTKIAVENIMK